MNFLKQLYDKEILSDLRIKPSSKEDVIFCKVKRSKYLVSVPLKITTPIAYLAGVIAGDGNIALSRRRTTKFPRTSIRIYNASKNYLLEVNRLFKKEFGVEGIIRTKQDENCFELKLDNKVVWLYFTRIVGLPLKKRNLNIPHQFTDAKLFKFFIAGFFDTDGFFSDNSYGIMLSSRNTEFLKKLTFLSKKFYGIEFGKVTEDNIRVGYKNYGRVYVRLRRAYNDAFAENIPLIHERFKN